MGLWVRGRNPCISSLMNCLIMCNRVKKEFWRARIIFLSLDENNESVHVCVENFLDLKIENAKLL